MTSVADPRRWLVLVAIAMAIFLGTVDASIVNVALPTLVEELHTSFAAVQWIVLAYMLTQATLVLGIGRLGDIVGKKPIFTAGFVVFTVGSALAGISPDIATLIAARVVQGIGSAMIFALGFAIVAETFPPHERGRALGINGTSVSIGIISGPILGGLILGTLDWRWIFLVNLPIGVVGTLTALRYIPPSSTATARRFDFLGAGLFFGATAALLLSLTSAQELGLTYPSVLAGFGVAVVLGVAFVEAERRVPDPMLDLGVFRIRTLTAGLVAGFTAFLAIGALLLILPFYLERTLGFPRAPSGSCWRRCPPRSASPPPSPGRSPTGSAPVRFGPPASGSCSSLSSRPGSSSTSTPPFPPSSSPGSSWVWGSVPSSRRTTPRCSVPPRPIGWA